MLAQQGFLHLLQRDVRLSLHEFQKKSLMPIELRPARLALFARFLFPALPEAANPDDGGRNPNLKPCCRLADRNALLRRTKNTLTQPAP